MQHSDPVHIVPGITLTAEGQASIAPGLTDVLFDLAIALEESTGLAVDVEHVVAAIVLASRGGNMKAELPLSAEDATLLAKLETPVRQIFAIHRGKVGREDA